MHGRDIGGRMGREHMLMVGARGSGVLIALPSGLLPSVEWQAA